LNNSVLAIEHRMGTWFKTIATIALSAFTIVAFSFPVPMLFAVIAAVAVFAGILSPASLLVLYAMSLVFESVSLSREFLVGVPTAIGAFFLSAFFLHTLISRDTLRLRSRIPGLVTLTVIIFFVAALEKPAWTLSQPRGIITFVALWGSAWASGQLLVHPTRSWHVAWALAVSAVAVSLLTVYESTTGHYNQFRLFSSDMERAYGLSDPNYTAATLVTLMPFLVAILVAFRSVLVKVFALSAVGLLLVAVAHTESRGGLIGVLVTGVAAVFWVPISSNSSPTEKVAGEKANLRTTPWMRIGITAVLLSALGVGVKLAPDTLWDRLRATIDERSDPDKETRVRLWEIYLDKWKESPWWGYGPGYLDPATADQRLMVPHNTQIELLIEVGLIGTCAFFFLNGVVWWEALKARKLLAKQGQLRLSILSGAVAASLVGFHVTAFFLTRARTKELWMFFGLVAALHHMARSGSERYCADQTWR
jgi:O-antigen ligase